MQRLYFVRLFREKRWLFALVALFCLGQAFFHFKGVETVPFFLYGMYSEPDSTQRPNYRFEIYENENPLDISALAGLNRDMVLTPISRFASAWPDPLLPVIEHRFGTIVTADQLEKITAALTNDEADRHAFGQWFRRYLEQSLDRPIGRITVKAVPLRSAPESATHNQVLFET